MQRQTMKFKRGETTRTNITTEAVFLGTERLFTRIVHGLCTNS